MTPLTEDQQLLILGAGSVLGPAHLLSATAIERLTHYRCSGAIAPVVVQLRPAWAGSHYLIGPHGISLDTPNPAISVRIDRRRLLHLPQELPDRVRMELRAHATATDTATRRRLLCMALALPDYSNHMDTMSGGADQDGDEAGETANAHYSTGRLTPTQTRVVTSWRQTLTAPDTKRWQTANGRPPASSSDCIAAAVLDLLDHEPPDHAALIRYAARVRDDLDAQRAGRFPVGSAVSWYLPPTYSDRVDAMLSDAQDHHAAVLDDIRDRALEAFPNRSDSRARAARILAECGAAGVPIKAYRLPAGTIARMAIDRWARRSPASVIAAAVAYGRNFHEQQHRARKDMGTGTTPA